MSNPSPIEEASREVLARYHRAMYEARADDLADLYAVDAVHEFPLLFPGMPARLAGREQIRETYSAAWAAAGAVTTLEEIRNVVVHLTTDPEVIVVEQEVAGTVSTTGRRIDARGVLVMRIHDGLLVNVRDYLDALTINHALGRLPAIVADLDVPDGNLTTRRVSAAGEPRGLLATSALAVEQDRDLVGRPAQCGQFERSVRCDLIPPAGDGQLAPHRPR